MLLPTIALAYSPFQGVDIQNSACNPTNPSDFNEMACQNYMRRGGSGLVPTEPVTSQDVLIPDQTPSLNLGVSQMVAESLATSTEATSTPLTLEEIKTNELTYLKSLCEQLVSLLQQLAQVQNGATK